LTIKGGLEKRFDLELANDFGGMKKYMDNVLV